MRKYRVVITASALRDMEALYNYIAYNLNSPNSAKKLYLKIANSIQSLEVFAERYKVFSKEQGHLVRRIIVDNYSAFYVIDVDCVMVTRVLYSASDLNERLRN